MLKNNYLFLKKILLSSGNNNEWLLSIKPLQVILEDKGEERKDIKKTMIRLISDRLTTEDILKMGLELANYQFSYYDCHFGRKRLWIPISTSLVLMLFLTG